VPYFCGIYNNGINMVTTISPEQLQSYFRLLDATDPNHRDPRPYLRFAMSILWSNPRLLGHYNIRTTAVTSCSWNIVAKDNTASTHLELTRNRLQAAIETVLESHAPTPFFGVSIWNIRWKYTNNIPKPVLTKIPLLQSEQLLPMGANILADVQQCERMLRIDGSSEDFIVDTDSLLPVRGGILRTICFTELLRRMTISEIGGYIQLLKGLVQIIRKDAATEQEISEAEKALHLAPQRGFLSTSEYIEYKLNEIAGGNAQAFAQLIELFDNDIAIASVGQANTMSLPRTGGSRAAVQIQHRISSDIHFADMVRCERLMNQLLLKDYQKHYDFTAEECPWKFSIVWNEDRPLEETARAIVALQQTGLEFNEHDLYAYVGMRKKE
jgi:hypothetical protein